jgi:serine/threonine-protein kinase HipA
VRRASSSPAQDLLQLFNAVLYNFLIGNHDAHGKNFSLLYLPEGDRATVRLAPFYDLVSTAIYPQLTPKMAMKVGKSSLPAECRLRNWELYWEAIGFSQKQANRQTLEFMDNLVDLCESPKSEVEEKIQGIIRARASALREVMG